MKHIDCLARESREQNVNVISLGMWSTAKLVH